MNNTDKKGQTLSALHTQSLIHDLRQIIDQARGHVAATANYALTMMYWHIGERINSEVLGNQRAEYGKQIVSQVAHQLQEEYGKKGFEERTIRRMMQFAQTFPNLQILSPLVSELSREIVNRNNETKRTMINQSNYHIISNLQLLMGGVISADYLHLRFDLWRSSVCTKHAGGRFSYACA